jgi:putative ATP-binding cassette transporter
LSRVVGHLDDAPGLGRMLSGGEQQRLTFARLLIDPPDHGEATLALDEVREAKIMDFLRTDLPPL